MSSHYHRSAQYYKFHAPQESEDLEYILTVIDELTQELILEGMLEL